MPVSQNVRALIQKDDPLNVVLDLRKETIEEKDIHELATLIILNHRIGRILWPEKSNFSIESPDFKSINEHLDKNNQNFCDRPTDYEYAVLSSCSYSDDGGITQLSRLLPDWSVHKIYSNKQGGYYGMIYRNNKTAQIVFAHRGTEPKNVGSLNADLQSIFRNKLELGGQQEAVYEILPEVLKIAKELNFHISTTGHSLGGWLAEMTVFLCHNRFNYPAANAVTFESPGSEPMLSLLLPNIHNSSVNVDLNHLDIISYQSYPNSINTCNKPLGTRYQVFPDIKGISNWSGLYTLSAHKIDPIVACFDIEKRIPREYVQVLDWPSYDQFSKVFKHISSATDYRIDMTSNDLKKRFASDFEAHYRVSEVDASQFQLSHFPRDIRTVLERFEAYRNIQSLKEKLMRLPKRFEFVNPFIDVLNIYKIEGGRIAFTQGGATLQQFRRLVMRLVSLFPEEVENLVNHKILGELSTISSSASALSTPAAAAPEPAPFIYHINRELIIRGIVQKAGVGIGNIKNLPPDIAFFDKAIGHQQKLVDKGIKATTVVEKEAQVTEVRDDLLNIDFANLADSKSDSTAPNPSAAYKP